MNVIISWVINILLGIVIISILSIFVGKNPVTDKKVEELELVIRTRAIVYSWIWLMITFAFDLITRIFKNNGGYSSQWDSLFYILLAVIIYGVTYLINKRKYA